MFAGLSVTSLGFALLRVAARGYESKSSVFWLLECLTLLTMGELLVRPVTQSVISQLAPRRLFGLTFALWHGATAIGFWTAGQLGSAWHRCPQEDFFALTAFVPLLACMLSLAQRGSLQQSPEVTACATAGKQQGR